MLDQSQASMPPEVKTVFGELVSFRSPFEIWENNWSLLCLEWMFYIADVVIIYNAWKRDKHVLYYGASCAISVGYAELSILMFQNSRSWWYEHFTIQLFKGNIPLFIFAAYFFMYSTSITFAKSLKLPKIKEAWMSSILAYLTIFTIDHFGADQAFWTYNNTDLTLTERSLAVPWAEIYLLGFLPFNMTLISERFHTSSISGFPIKRILMSAAIAGSLTYMEYIVTYGILCMFLGGSTVFCGVAIPIILTAVLYVFKPELWTTYSQHSGNSPSQHKIFKTVATLFGVLLVFVFLANPVNNRLIGPKQSIGPCNVKEYVINQIFLPVVREKYICVDGSRDLDTWDFHCLSPIEIDSLRNKTTQWYPICGKPVENRTNFIFASIIPSTIWITLVYQLILKSKTFQNVNGKID